MTSRETSEYFIPSVPIEMPSLTVMVPNICGIAPALFDGRVGALGENIETQVAGRDRAVAVRHADDRLFEIVVAKADRPQHRAIRRTLHTLRHNPASQILSHRKSPYIPASKRRLHHNGQDVIKPGRRQNARDSEIAEQGDCSRN
jgi:hypothetical protein